MEKNSTIIKVDITKFNSLAQSTESSETANYLRRYYELLFKLSTGNGWEIIKTIGDCVLITAPDNGSAEIVEDFCANIRSEFDVTVHYRKCSFEEVEFSYNDYSCKDVIGKDINNLFMEDSSTMVVK